MKKRITQKNSFIISAMIVLTLGLFSCNKSEDTNVSKPLVKVGLPVTNANLLTGFVKGTMLKDSVYYINNDVYINKLDTLLIQEGAKIYFKGAYSIIVKGSIFSLGSKEKPIYFTVQNTTKTDSPTADVATDPAYKGLWGGILGDTSTKAMVIKWTHVEFGCAKLGTSPVSGIGNTKNAYMISFVNPNGNFILEDSWIYGAVDDPIRIQGGKIHVMRNTFEKSGFVGGEGINIKSGTVGNVAYNLFIGAATNGPKASNSGGKTPVTNVYFYNNTIVNCGYRRAEDGRGGSLSYEQFSSGAAYNNLMVNCKYGPRLVGYKATYSGNALLPASSDSVKYGYNYNYVDFKAQADQIYPVPYSTPPSETDFPKASSFLPPGYLNSTAANPTQGVYDGTKALASTANTDPKFVNFPLPADPNTYQKVSYATGFDFHLKAGSPAIGKGFTGFSPLVNGIVIEPNFGATEITLPSKDSGAYPSDGSGNKH